MKPEKAVPASAVVAGGGVVGLACAMQLRSLGIPTLLVDAATALPPASWGNAGHIAIEQIEPLASVHSLASVPRRLFCRGGAVALPPRDIGTWLPFAWRLARASFPSRFRKGKAALAGLMAHAIPAWRRLAARAEARELLAEDGHFVVWESASTEQRGRAAWRNADIGTATLRDMTAVELAQLAALLPNAPAGGVRFGGTARVRDPGLLLERLRQAFLAAGGSIQSAQVARIETGNSRAWLVLDDGSRLDADTVVVAAGIGAARLWRPLGIRVPLIAERGYHLQADAPGWPDLPPVVFEDRSMIVSRFESGLRAASFVEFAAAESAPDVRKWDRLRHHCGELQLPFSAPPRQWMGARPTLPDYLPAIGRSRIAGNLLYAFGHQHLGLTLAAVTGELIAALSTGEPPEVDLAPFDLERF